MAELTAGTDAYICVDTVAAYECEQKTAAWHAEHPGPTISITDLMAYPEPAAWHIFHADCDPDPDRHAGDCHGYWLPVADVSDPLDLLGATAHLMGKNWLEHTDWSEFLYRVLRANGWRS